MVSKRLLYGISVFGSGILVSYCLETKNWIGLVGWLTVGLLNLTEWIKSYE